MNWGDCTMSYALAEILTGASLTQSFILFRHISVIIQVWMVWAQSIFTWEPTAVFYPFCDFIQEHTLSVVPCSHVLSQLNLQDEETEAESKTKTQIETEVETVKGVCRLPIGPGSGPMDTWVLIITSHRVHGCERPTFKDVLKEERHRGTEGGASGLWCQTQDKMLLSRLRG